MISRVHGHGVWVFCHWKRFGIFKAVASLDTYQITNYSDSKKKYRFTKFSKIRERVFKSIISGQKYHSFKTWFIQNYVLRNTMTFIQIIQRQGDEQVFRMDSFLTMITNSFVNLIQNIFHFFYLFMISKIVSLYYS